MICSKLHYGALSVVNSVRVTVRFLFSELYNSSVILKNLLSVNQSVTWLSVSCFNDEMSSSPYYSLTCANFFLIIIIITNKKIKVTLSRKRCRGTLQDYDKGKIVNVSQNCGQIEMSSAGVWMERGRKEF